VKTKTYLCLALLGLSAWLSAQSGGDFQVVRSTLDGGGEQSSGGPYEPTGTHAQPQESSNAPR